MTRQRQCLCAVALSIAAAMPAPALDVAETDEAITIRDGDAVMLVYHKAEVPPPPGEDAAYRRSGFIHPVCAPSGAELTGMHPDDHVHHLGLWHAWVNTSHDGEKLDFWNLKKKQGRVRYRETLALVRPKPPATTAGFVVRQEHVAVGRGGDGVILSEEFSVLASESDGGYVVDYDTTQKNVTGHALELPAYRYGGPIAYRAPAHWVTANSRVLTSEGRTREDGHTTRGRWVAFSGPTEKGPASLAILCHPGNHDAPQRMRIWPPDTHGGRIFFNYVPIQETAWAIGPGESSTMRYRLLVRDGGIDKDAIEAAWKDYAGK